MSFRWGIALFLSFATPAVAGEAGVAVAPGKAKALEQSYVGTHRLRVNRIPGKEWTGTVTVSRQDGALRLGGALRNGAHYLELSGTIEPVSPRKFHLDGELRGIPDMAWADEAPRERSTKGRFTFEATGQRRYWRLYQVDGRDCVCDSDCGNDFCYIDIEFLKGQTPK